MPQHVQRSMLFNFYTGFGRFRRSAWSKSGTAQAVPVVSPPTPLLLLASSCITHLNPAGHETGITTQAMMVSNI